MNRSIIAALGAVAFIAGPVSAQTTAPSAAPAKTAKPAPMKAPAKVAKPAAMATTAATAAKPAATRAVATRPIAAKPAAARPVAAAATRGAQAPRTAKSLACSKTADQRNLHGKPRAAFMESCKRG